MPPFFKKIIRTTEYEINFKLVCAKLMAIGNNCAADKAINVIFRIKITSYNFLSNYKLFVLLSTLPQFYETEEEVCFLIFPGLTHLIVFCNI